MRKTSLESIHKLAKVDKRVLFIGSDLGAGVLEHMRQDMPERWFMEGISEQHIIGMAAGLALEGFIPYVNTIATFLTRRCFEQIVIDLSLHRLPVRLIGNGGGVVYAPLGPTHQAIEDIAIMRVIPNMTVVAPCDADEMSRLMERTLDWPGPIYIRLGKGGDDIVSEDKHGFEIGKSITLRSAGDVLFLTTGIMTQRAIAAADLLSQENILAGVLHVHTLKPFDEQKFLESIKGVKLVVVAEEHVLSGGLGSIVIEVLSDSDLLVKPKIKRVAIPNEFSDKYGSQENLLASWGLDASSLVQVVKENIVD